MGDDLRYWRGTSPEQGGPPRKSTGGHFDRSTRPPGGQWNGLPGDVFTVRTVPRGTLPGGERF